MNSSAAAQRRLAVVLATDVAGYSRMMSADEDGTVAFLNRNRDGFWLPKIAEHSGRLIDIAGDGMLIEFASAQNAVRFALELQEGMAERNRDRPDQKKMLLRVGIHLAEILFDEKRIYGDGVNIAARLEQIAEPGGINASDSVVREIDGKLPVEIVHKGETQLKNIPRPSRCSPSSRPVDSRNSRISRWTDRRSPFFPLPVVRRIRSRLTSPTASPKT